VKSEKRLIFYTVAVGSMVVGSLLYSPLAQATTGLRSRITPSHHQSDQPTAHASVPFSLKLEDQLLAILRYLPVTFQPSSAPITTTTTSTTTTTLSSTTSTSTTSTTTTTIAPNVTTIADPTKLQKGAYVWRFSALTTLKHLWRVGTQNVVLQGALMRFQLAHNLNTTGTMNGSTWQTLVSAAKKNELDPSSYNYVYVRQTLPELLTLYRNGKPAYQTYVNTGVYDAPTQTGTYPVYERFLTTTMSGVEPNGTKYSDPGIPWVSYFHGGDALHGFIRSEYGYPQSLGCVEMPFSHAETLFPFTPIGTLVTIQ
jgi:lipoprotein-anchoring transpeptidase ErfK/SrfK